MFILVKNIIQTLKFNENDTFEFKIKDSSTLEGDFQLIEPSSENKELSLVRGSVSVYSNNAEKNQVWVVFRCTSGDPFKFREVFDVVLLHPQVQDYLQKEDTQDQM